jgi:hypothetical protein
MLPINPTTKMVPRRVVASGYQGGLANPTPLAASKIAQVRGSLLSASGSSGLVEGVKAYEVEAPPPV